MELAKGSRMMVKHSYLRNSSRHSSGFFVRVKNGEERTQKTVTSFLLSVLLTASFSSGFANQDEQDSTYGPIKAGQTLWDIAQATRANDNISIEQQVYALYKANPDAFQSGNMNVLSQGILLHIPDNELISKITNAEATKQLNKHVHAIEVLRVDAKHLRTAKANTKEYKKRIRILQKRLGKYRHKTRDWNKAYLKLVTAKRNHSKSKRKVAKLHSLLLEKATLKYTKPTKNETKIVAVAAVNETNERLTQIQSSLADLNQSNTTLTEKVNELATLNERVGVLEEELGKNDEVVIQLRHTLQALQETIQKTTDKQLLENEKHQQKIEELSALKDAAVQKAAKAQTAAEATETEVSTQEATTVEKTDKSPEEKEVVAEEKASSKPDETVTEVPSEQLAPLETTQSTTKEVDPSPVEALNVKEDASALGFTPDEYTKMQALKAGFSPSEIESLSEEKTKEAAATLSTAKRFKETLPKLNETNKRLTKFQASQHKSGSTSTGLSSFWGFLKDNIILIGGLLNGLILIFVIFRIIANKQSPLTVEDFKPDRPAE